LRVQPSAGVHAALLIDVQREVQYGQSL